MLNRDYRIYVLLGSCLVIGILFLVGTDHLVGKSIENTRAVRLKRYSEAGMSAVVQEVTELKTEVGSIRERVERSAARTYPRLADIKELSGTFGLRFERMERVSQASASPSGPSRYNTTVQGDPRRLVRFLERLEVTYIVSCEQMVLYPVDESGDLVALSMSILIDESGT